MKIFSFLFFLSFFGLTLYGQSDRSGSRDLDSLLEACIDRDPTTVGMIECTQEASLAWDKELNVQYSRLKGLLDDTGKAALKSAQLAWIDMRDKEYGLINGVYGSMDGTIYRIIAVGSKMEIVKTRALQLKEYADMIEGVE